MHSTGTRLLSKQHSHLHYITFELLEQCRPSHVFTRISEISRNLLQCTVLLFKTDCYGGGHLPLVMQTTFYL
jgi:hypothetical protein